ncbi:hypothetical protein [Methylobacterium sp. J-077]|uniref:hypothetical protein n=1 Tax=Methylobacterium sp. J-077 TaxID=2836656 RepID=UPI001FB9AE33|nr:hypothetical protein [Methylobacterium sp. J-077]MCJ2124928.1 hypothetical protein [Methylobacterium sp. J-077]
MVYLPGGRRRAAAWRSGVSARAEEVAFLEETQRWRQQFVLVLARAEPQEPLFKVTSAVIEAIDDVAKAVTGDRRTFYQRVATTPGRAAREVVHRRVAGAPFFLVG